MAEPQKRELRIKRMGTDVYMGKRVEEWMGVWVEEDEKAKVYPGSDNHDRSD